MPTSGSTRVWLVDTSVAIPLVVADHEHHGIVFKILAGRALGLSGHAAFETFSVLTRLPAPARRTAAAVSRLLATNFPHSRFMGADRAAALLQELARRSISGGSVYDALVAATAHEQELTLVTRDRRALETYRALGTDLEVIG